MQFETRDLLTKVLSNSSDEEAETQGEGPNDCSCSDNETNDYCVPFEGKGVGHDLGPRLNHRFLAGRLAQQLGFPESRSLV